MDFKDIPQLTRSGSYKINVEWKYLDETLYRWSDEAENKTLARLNMNPEFQRGHVWAEQQQIAYVEYKLRGGRGSNVILFNCVGWMNSFEGPFVLVDGKQRLEAVLKFLRNELPVFGYLYKEFTGKLRGTGADFIFEVNDLKTEKEVLQWYKELNFGGTPHSQEELDKINLLLSKELYEY